MPRARSSRASAVKARGLFKELANEDEESGKSSAATTKSSNKKRKKEPDDDDEEFVADQIPDDVSDGGDIPNENVSEHQSEPDDSGIADEAAVVDTNEIQKRRSLLLELWADYVEIQVPELREIPADVRSRWKKQKGKKYCCPESDCRKSFTTVPGIVYHYKRCGVFTESSGLAKCKLCSETAPLAKKLLYHLFNDHLPQLPPPPEELTIGLADKKGSKGNKYGVSQRREPRLRNYYETTLQYRKSKEQRNLFATRMPLRSQWLPLPALQSETYLPFCEVSASMRVKGEQKWRSLRRFQAIAAGGHRTFFAGGPVFSAAWVPIPTSCSKQQDQVLALSVGLNFEDSHAYSDQDAEFCLIEFWRFGKLGNELQESEDVEPHMVFGVASTDGIVWDMEWCPFGNSWLSPSTKVAPEHYPRLGLLCLACGNGVVKILSVPHAEFVTPSSKESPPIFMSCPVLILDPPGVGPLTNHDPSICKCISWSTTRGNEHIAAGFGSGVIAVWDIETKSRFLKSKESTKECDVFLPKWSFSAHATSVNALCWCPYEGSMILVSGSPLDRDLVFWDLTDLRSARRVGGKKAVVTSVEWPFRWQGVFVSQDAGFSGLSASVVFVSPVRKDRPTSSTCVHRSTVWSASYNEWCNAEASGDASGEVVVFRDFDDRNSKTKSDARTPIYQVQPEPLTGGTNENGNSNVYYSYDSMVKHFGMSFNDNDLSSARKIRADQFARIKSSDNMSWQHPSDYPLVSVNRVAWNPNKESYTWIFTGGQSGVCRVSCVSLLKQ